jgi:predicted metal-dependent phosphoesterase TrpH
MLIDLHAYTTPSGGRPLEDVASEAHAMGLDAVLVADRNASAATAAKVLEGGLPLPVFVGVELETRTGDVIVVVPRLDPFFTREEWKQLTVLGPPTVEEVRALVETEGGVVLLAHPYDRSRTGAPRDRMFALKGVRAVELGTATSDGRANQLACESVSAGNLNGFGGSAQKGRARSETTWATLFADTFDSQQGVVDALLSGDFWPIEILGRGAQPSGTGRNEPPRRDGPPRDAGRREGGPREGGPREGGGRDGGRRGPDRGDRGDRRPRR